MKKLILVFSLFLMGAIGVSQNIATISGTAIDGENSEQLPYVSVQVNDA